jgi:hypothetical protein
VLKKTSASTGLVIVTAAGALLASSPAYALDSLAQGCCSSHHHRSHHRNRNWNGNHHRGRIYIRIYIYNKNNNHAVAIAKPEHRRRRDFIPTVTGIGAGTGGGVVAARRPARAFRDSAPAEPAPAVAPVDQSTANNTPSAPVAPATSGGTAPGLDEASTG